ncbi:MAG TPA: T9SS type A sorting domain-containing protein, partial [Saprospiraceae bacterium]|nr:T9SS type A sorting domain-containing protein [Saprospiraceae bacterium]
QHAEWFWAREFPDAYIWLFQNAVATSGPSQGASFGVFPNPAGDWIRLSGFDNGARVRIQILGADGKLWRDTTILAGEAIWTGDLPAGAFVVKAKIKGKAWKTAKLLLN